MKELGYGDEYKYCMILPIILLTRILPDAVKKHTIICSWQQLQRKYNQRFFKNRWKGKYGY
jgi:putative ATPase